MGWSVSIRRDWKTLRCCYAARAGSSSWSFVFTCVVDSWESTYRLIRREHGGALNIGVKTIAFSFADHYSAILEAFPKMARVLHRKNVQPLFTNLKILDLVLSNAGDVGTNTAAWVGESDILEWYWTQHLQKGSEGVARSRFAQKLGSVEADQFLTAVPIEEFSSDECRLATGLQEDRVVWIRDEQVGFEHDLLGDWARTRLLIGRRHEILEQMPEKAFNPRWHRAIRLYGLRLLENQQHDTHEWVQLITGLSRDGKHKVESDLVLESVVFAGNAEHLLEQVWSHLAANEGTLLTRLLTRFLHVASFPDPRFGRLTDEVGMAAILRIPFRPLWFPVLRILYKHRAEAIRLATDEVTKVADLWLANSPDGAPLRNEAARILLDATPFVVRDIREKAHSVDPEIRERVFSRLLTAATACPDDVADLALTLVERRKRSMFAGDKKGVSDRAVRGKRIGVGNIWGPRGPLAHPWPDGPRRRISHDVHNGFLATSNQLQSLFEVRPEVAKEVLLALLIREPLPTKHYPFDDPIREFLHVSAARDWTPPMFFHGPFLAFLQTNWEKGIETIVDLTNFATDRWSDNRNPRPAPLRATIDGHDVDFFGSGAAYYWYRDALARPGR